MFRNRPATRGGGNREIASLRNFHKRMYLLGAATSYIILPNPRKYQLVTALFHNVILFLSISMIFLQSACKQLL